jgi:hypothetical protein
MSIGLCDSQGEDIGVFRAPFPPGRTSAVDQSFGPLSRVVALRAEVP